MESNENEEKETYVYLDFGSKLSNDTFQNEVFFRVANLHKNNPLVQVNDSIFKGFYDHSIGTNLFFEERSDAQSVNPFSKKTSIQLKPLITETRIIDLKPIKILQNVAAIPQIKNVNFNLDWNYDTILERFENGSLNIENLMINDGELDEEEQKDSQSIGNEIVDSEETNLNTKEIPEEIVTNETALKNNLPSKSLEIEYEELKALARIPVKRLTEEEFVEECEHKYKANYEYHNLEKQVLKPSDAFTTETVTEINEETILHCVDLNRSALLGLIPPPIKLQKSITDDDKEKLFTLDNFDNLSLGGRYYVLNNCVKQLEKLENISRGELEKKDNYGRTPKETLHIYKKLCKALERRLSEIKKSCDGIH